MIVDMFLCKRDILDSRRPLAGNKFYEPIDPNPTHFNSNQQSLFDSRQLIDFAHNVVNDGLDLEELDHLVDIGILLEIA